MGIYDTRDFRSEPSLANLVIFYNGQIFTRDLVYREEWGNRAYGGSQKNVWTLGNPNAAIPPDIEIRSAIVSREHGQFICENEHWYYVDIVTNKNGTYYNGELIKNKGRMIPLKQGDILRIDSKDLNAVDQRGVLILFLETPGDGVWTHYPLDKNVINIGRNPGKCHIVLGKPYISGQHAQIIRKGNDFYLQDMGSLAGTFMNGNEITTMVKLRERDSFSICDYYFIFSDGELIFNQPADAASGRKANDANIYASKRMGANGYGQEQNRKDRPDGRRDSYQDETFYYNDERGHQGGQAAGRNYDYDRDEGGYRDNISKPVILRADIRTRKVKSNTGFGEKELIRNIKLDIKKGTLVALLGTAGAGKSTVMNCLNGMDVRGVEGTVMFKNVDLTKHFNQMSSLIGSVPQQKVFHPTFTPEQEFRFAAMMRLPGDTSKDAIDKRVDETIKMLKMEGVRNNQNIKLSGGEQSRVNLGIELVADRELLCLDEPDAGLSPDLKRQLVHILRDLAHKYDKSVLTIIHDVSDINLFDQVIILVKYKGVGRLAFSGTPQQAKDYFGCDVRDVYELLSENPGKYILGENEE